MSKKRVYLDYLQDIQESLSDIIAFTNGMKSEVFLGDKKTQYAVIRALEIIGEAVKKIPESIKNQYPHIPWKDIAGMRDILIHEYFGVNTNVIWKSVQDDIPVLKINIDKILSNAV